MVFCLFHVLLGGVCQTWMLAKEAYYGCLMVSTKVWDVACYSLEDRIPNTTLTPRILDFLICVLDRLNQNYFDKSRLTVSDQVWFSSGSSLDPGFSDRLHPVDDCVSSSLEVLSPLFYIHDCVSKHTSNTTVKFADDTIVAGLILDGDEKVYRNEVATLEQWSGGNHLSWTSWKPRRSLWTTETKGISIPQLLSTAQW